MKNYEKYAEKIREDADNDICCNFIRPRILKTDSCSDTSCSRCQMLQMLWLLEEYEEPEEPEVDWSKVEVDTPILVRNSEYATTSWVRRYFAEYKDGIVYAWNGGKTSWTTDNTYPWKYAKLAENEE